MEQNKVLGAVILAAGLSSRMGSFKPLLPVAGKPLVQRTVEALRAAGAQEIVVVTGHRAEELEPLLASLGVRWVRNAAYAESKMYDSLKLGVQALRSRCHRLLIAPVDNPLLHKDTVERLLADPAAAVRPFFAGRPGHPVVVSQALYDYLLQYPGEQGLRGAVERCGQLHDVPVEDPCVDMDADRPLDYLRILRQFRSERGQTLSLVMLGAGQMGAAARRLLNEAGYTLLAYGDNSGPYPRQLEGVPVLPVAQALALQPDMVLAAVASAQRGSELAVQAKECGYGGQTVLLSDLMAAIDIRKASLWQLAARIAQNNITGSIAELGVYKGETAKLLNGLFPERPLYLFDTFAGFDARDLETEAARVGRAVRAEEFADTAEELVRGALPHPERALFRTGWFPQTARGLEGERYALVSLDADLYAPTLAGLQYFWPRLTPGGAIVLHDYNNPRFEGAKQALADYEAQLGRLLPLVPLGDVHGSAVLVKG